jgi:hypothetical protein
VVYDACGIQKCRHWEAHTGEFEKWESDRFDELEREVGDTTPLSSLPVWHDIEGLRLECEVRCKTSSDTATLKKAKTMEALERFIFARTRGGSELTSNKMKGVRHCNIQMVEKDLQERGVDTAGMSEATKRARMEVRLRLEQEWKRMRVLRRDERFLHSGDDSIRHDLTRTIIDLLHAPTRMNEKVPLPPPPPPPPLSTCIIIVDVNTWTIKFSMRW